MDATPVVYDCRLFLFTITHYHTCLTFIVFFGIPFCTHTGKRYAQASPTRQSGDPSIIGGKIEFEQSDLNTAIDNEIFEDLLLHEMAHMLGLGTKWDATDIDMQIDASTKSYIGANAVAAWRDIGCTGDLPVASESDLSHWNEKCLVNEVLTPTLRFRTKALVSSMTIGALKDLGYEVDESQQDAYGLGNLGDCGNYCPAARRGRRLGMQKDEVKPELSEKAELALKQSAAAHFKHHAERLNEQAEDREYSAMKFVKDTVSYIYEENGHYHSRIIHQSELEQLF